VHADPHAPARWQYLDRPALVGARSARRSASGRAQGLRRPRAPAAALLPRRRRPPDGLRAGAGRAGAAGRAPQLARRGRLRRAAARRRPARHVCPVDDGAGAPRVPPHSLRPHCRRRGHPSGRPAGSFALRLELGR
jgi:hypothetical protein